MKSGTSPTSNSTSLSLLDRARAQDAEAWRRLSSIYAPLVYRWARQSGLQESDAADLGQEVFRTVAARIHDFRRDRPGDSFRGWLWGITRLKLKEHFRRQINNPQAVGGEHGNQLAESLAASPPEEDSDDDLAQTQSTLVHRVLDLIRVEFEGEDLAAFWRVTVDDRAAVDIASELGMTPKAVRQAKYRVLRRLRSELDGLT